MYSDNNDELDVFVGLIVGLLSTLLAAVITSLIWAIPIEVVWNLAVTKWVDTTVPTVGYWQTVSIAMTLKFVRSLIWK